VRAENAALRWLWARRWVELLDDERAMGAGQPAEDAITALGLDYHLLTAFTSFVAIDSQVVNAGGQGQNVRQPLPLPDGVSNLALEQPTASAPAGLKTPMKAMRSVGPSGAFGISGPVAPAPEPAPPPARLANKKQDDDKAKDEEKTRGDSSKTHAAPAVWVVTAGKSTTVGATGPLVEAIRAALASGRAACLAASDAGKPIRIRLTVDARGSVVRVELVTGDRNAEACLRAALVGLSSATTARGVPTGTVEITVRAGRT
jgi:Ca-activated chloride channel homolog